MEQPYQPNYIVSMELLTFLRDVFKENYQKDNWYLDPEKQMYIREDYPRNEEKAGMKPGIVLGDFGQIKDAVRTLGNVGHTPMFNQLVGQMRASEAPQQSNFSLQAVSTTEREAQRIAYLAKLSINNFVDFLIGNRGIIHIHALDASAAQPFRRSSENKLYKSNVRVEYVVNLSYMRSTINKPLIEEFDIDMNEKAEGGGVTHNGVYSITEDGGENTSAVDPGVKVNTQTNNNTTDNDVGITLDPTPDHAYVKDNNIGITLEINEDLKAIPHIQTGVYIEQKDDYTPSEILPIWVTSHKDRDFSSIIETKTENISLSESETKLLILPFSEKAILSTIYLRTVNEGDFKCQILDSKNNATIEYSSPYNSGSCYDVLDIIYLNEDGEDEVVLKITNIDDEDITFESIRIQGLKL